MQSWINEVLADPVTKLPKEINQFKQFNNYIDARVYLKNTCGWKTWETGQKFYEKWLENGEVSILKKEPDFIKSKKLEKPLYDEIKLNGRVLDVGGGVGTLREFLEIGAEYLCLDPHYNSLEKIPLEKIEAYKCLKEEFNYIIGFAEFLPIKDNCFDVVHMRSMLDHVQIPDLVILEANRVLTKEGKLVIGLTVDGGQFGKFSFKDHLKELTREVLYYLGLKSFRDYHTWHPTFKNLKKIISDNGFIIEKNIWQDNMDDKVVYIVARKKFNN